MIYRKFKDKELSWLGMGCMRFPVTESAGPIDVPEATKMLQYAYDHGVNFFDTSYFYHAGKSEGVLGKALAKYPRDKWYLADKFPGNMLKWVDGKLRLEIGGFGMQSKDVDSPAELFEEQLERCGVDYFDFYMLHNVAELTYDMYTDEKVGILDYLLKQKKAGRIRHLGFSSHGRAETIEKFLRGRDCFEFAMIQINYLDWTLQEAGRKYDVLTKNGIAVLAMEPVRGGKLASREEKAGQVLLSAAPDKSPASWALRFFHDLQNMAVVVSGMSTMDQLKENLSIFDKIDPLTKSDRAVLDRAVAAMADISPCTICGYCVADCPGGLDIPMFLSLANEATFELGWTVNTVLSSLPNDKKPQACTYCGNCNPLCPQNIDIPAVIKKFNDALAAAK